MAELTNIAEDAKRVTEGDKEAWGVVGAATYLLARASLESGELTVAPNHHPGGTTHCGAPASSPSSWVTYSPSGLIWCTVSGEPS